MLFDCRWLRADDHKSKVNVNLYSAFSWCISQALRLSTRVTRDHTVLPATHTRTIPVLLPSCKASPPFGWYTVTHPSTNRARRELLLWSRQTHYHYARQTTTTTDNKRCDDDDTGDLWERKSCTALHIVHDSALLKWQIVVNGMLSDGCHHHALLCDNIMIYNRLDATRSDCSGIGLIAPVPVSRIYSSNQAMPLILTQNEFLWKSAYRHFYRAACNADAV